MEAYITLNKVSQIKLSVNFISSDETTADLHDFDCALR